MSSAVQTTCLIQAPPALVWRLLTDFPAYGSWNPVLPSIRGKAQKGAWIMLTIRMPGRPPVPVPARLTVVRPESELQWRASVPGMVAGDHFFRLTPQGDGATLLVHGEVFSGLLADTIMGRAVQEASREAYEGINAALKAHAEALAA
ncbi:SRPBCC domain-containing protein [Pararhodospirillum oryzae]|uniref:Polyketide cyclase n=1 Tax=Pararhodospirillum oryzae TaxID=478448 RepID=A0A512H4G4_9PROT|nr:SRPBCC domain-containing protein [Pararhodospirillum oryzae]GEO80354.1 hypothetical protein ROR02_04850 [Pararhodospirillum oryzae]